MSTDDTREALTAMVREGEAAGMYADHGAAGFCTDHGQAAARPTTVALDVDVIRARAADLRAVRYNCECQIGGVDAASIDADYLHSIGEQIEALLDALAARDAEVERLRGSADAWWTEYDKALTEGERLVRIINGYDRTPAEQRAAAAEAERDARTKIAYDVIAERDVLAATVARVEALAKDNRDRGGFGGVRLVAHVRIADLLAALDPKEPR